MKKTSLKAKEIYDKYCLLNSAVKAIRAKCIDCSAYQLNEVKLCPVKDCPLWKYRMGKGPRAKKD